MNANLSVTFLGVRGTAPCCDPAYQVYGGHTSCVLIQAGPDVIIFDAGSGIINAHKFIMHKPKTVHIFLSHVHLDHIMGLANFQYMWDQNVSIHIYAGTLQPYGGVQQVLGDFYKSPIFPIAWSDFPAKRVCHDFNSGESISIHDNLFLETCSLNHPDGATGYCLRFAKKSVCYVTDTEHMHDAMDSNILQLIQGTDLLIYDATFDDDSYQKHQGWGHSTWQEACRLARAAQVKQTAIFHHCPTNTDTMMNQHRKKIAQYHSTAFIAQQNMTLYL